MIRYLSKVCNWSGGDVWIGGKSSLLGGGSCFSMDSIYWIPWVLNLAPMQGLEHGDSLCDLLRSCGVVGEELS